MAKSAIATAYVQVAPAMDGVAPKVKKFFGDAGNSSGSSFGANFVDTFKNILVMAGIGTAVKEGLEASLTEGAGLEQSLGGIETLFKDSAGDVIAAAQNAYKTAGMSANSYMETVTSFSASLLQSLSGDTQQAAQVADMALTDMSDNANKMGSSLDSISEAYKSFARGQYQLLDNLKLGYGGTKTEMERLLADAQKLTGVKYDIDSLADVYSAIHAIQEETGITGTTAKEASSTLTGSFNAMKAAFSNVLGNLALGEDIGPSLDALAETTSTFLTDNLFPSVWNIVQAFPGALNTFLIDMIRGEVGPSGIRPAADTAIEAFDEAVDQNLPGLLESGGKTFASFVTGISGQLPSLMTTATSVITTFGTYIANNPDVIFETAGTVFADFLLGLSECLPDLATTALDIALSFGTYLLENADEITAAGIDLGGKLLSGLWDGIVSGWSYLSEKFSGLFESLLQGANNFANGGIGNSLVGSTPQPYAGGLRYVPYDGYLAVLHQGERVLTSGEAIAYNNGGTGGKTVVVNQYIYSEAKTAADLMEEARYEQEVAMLEL